MMISDAIRNEVKRMDNERVAKNTENVLLLAMSTLYIREDRDGKVVSDVYKYVYENEVGIDNKLTFYSDSQLVPGSKYLISYLDSVQRKLDRIIVINTAETVKYARTNPDRATGEYKELSISAYKYYKDQLSSFMRGQQFQFNGNNEQIEEEYIIENKYDEIELDSMFRSINRNESADRYLWDLANAIIGMDEEKSNDSTAKHIDLYIDTQGGDRNAIVEINAVVDLLRSRNVTVQKRIATDFNSYRGSVGIKYHTDINKSGKEIRKEGPQKIKDVSEQYSTYDLFSAMQSFKKFGMSTELVEFFTDNKPEIIATVERLNQAIQLCDMNAFDFELIKLAMSSSPDSDEGDTRLGIVKKDIYQNYKGIVDKIKQGGRPIVEEIRWCANKGFLQQALTLIESKMFIELYRSGTIYWGPEALVENSDSQISQGQAFQEMSKSWEDPIAVSLDKWCQKNITGPDYNKYNDEKNDSSKNPEDYHYIKDDNHDSAYIKLSRFNIDNIPDDLSEANPERLYLEWKRTKFGYFNWSFDRNNKDLFKLLRLHMALKNLRNTINHATDKNENRNYEDIKNAIDIYVNLANKVLPGNVNSSLARGDMTIFTVTKTDGITASGKLKLEGLLPDGSKAIVPYGKEDLSNYKVDNRIIVKIKDCKSGGIKECEKVNIRKEGRNGE